MGTIITNIRWADNTAQLRANLLQGIDTIDAMKTAVDKTAAALGGTGLLAAANKTAAAIVQLGGATKLTASEQERASALIDKAIEKYDALGIAAPTALKQLSDAMKHADDDSESFFAHLVSGVAVGELIAHAFENIGEAAIHGFEGAIESAVDLVSHSIEVGNALFEMSLKTGASVENLSALRYVASQTGIDFDSFGTTLVKMQQALGASGAKADEMSKTISKLGLDMQTLKNEKPDQAFIDIMSALEEIPNRADQAAAGIAIFGRGFKEMAGLTQESITDLIKEARDLGLVMSTEQAAAAHVAEIGWKSLQMQLEATSNSIGASVIPALIALEQVASEAFQQFMKGSSEAKGVFNDGQMQQSIVTVGEAIITATAAMAGFAQGALAGLKVVGDGAIRTAEAFLNVANAALEVGTLGTVDEKGKTILDRTQASIHATYDALQVLKSGFNATADVASSAFAAAESVVDGMSGRFGDTFKKTQSIIKDFADKSHNAFGGVGSDVEGVTKKVDTLDTTFQRMAASEAATVAAMASVLAGPQQVLKTLAQTTGTLRLPGVIFNAPAQDMGKFLLDSMNQAIGAMPDLSQQAKDHIASMLGGAVASSSNVIAVGLFAALDDLPKVMSRAFEGGGGATAIAKAFGTDLGSTIGKEIESPDGPLAENLPKSFDNVFGKALGGIAGGLVGGLIADGVTKLASWIVGLFDHTAEDLARDAGQRFGTKFSDATTKAIKADMDAGMSEMASELNHLTDIIKDAGGITAQNVGLMTSRFHDLFVMLGTGQMTAAQVNKQLQDSFPALAAAATDALGRWSDGLKEIIALDEQNGLHTQAITDAINTQAQNAATGLAAIVDSQQPVFDGYDAIGKAVADAQAKVDGLVANGQKGSAAWVQATNDLTAALQKQSDAAKGAGDSIDVLASNALLAFNAAIASGKTFAQALSSIAPSLDKIAKSFKDLGLQANNPIMKALLLQNSIATANPTLAAGIGGLSQLMIAAQNIPGLMTPEAFAGLESQTQTLYVQEQGVTAAQGGDTANALVPFQDMLHQAQDYANKTKTQLDPFIQQMIDQSHELGIWTDETQTAADKQLESTMALIKSNYDLIAALSGHPNPQPGTPGVPPGGPGGSTPGPGGSTPPDNGGGDSGPQPVSTVIGGEEGLRFAGAIATGGIITRALAIQRFIGGGIVAEPHMPLVGFGPDTALAAVTPGELLANAGQQSYLANLLSAGAAMASDLVRAPSVSRTALPLSSAGGDTFHVEFTIHALDAASVPKIVREQVHPALLELWRQSGGARRQTQKMLEIS